MAATDVTTSPVTITGIVIAITALVTATMPILIRWQTSRSKTSKEKLVSWEGLTERLAQERDRLQQRLDSSDKLCEEKLATAARQWVQQADQDRERIRALENEVERLRGVIQELRRS